MNMHEMMKKPSLIEEEASALLTNKAPKRASAMGKVPPIHPLEALLAQGEKAMVLGSKEEEREARRAQSA